MQNLMQEYSNTIKSTDVGLPWEIHFKVKKQFEATDLKRIFQFSIQLLADVTKTDPPYNNNITCLMEHLLTISENVLTWGYIPPMHILSLQQLLSFFNKVISLIKLTTQTDNRSV